MIPTLAPHFDQKSSFHTGSKWRGNGGWTDRQTHRHKDITTYRLNPPRGMSAVKTQTLSDATPSIGKIHPFSKIAATVEPAMQP